LARLLDEVSGGKVDPHTASTEILSGEFFKNGA